MSDNNLTYDQNQPAQTDLTSASSPLTLPPAPAPPPTPAFEMPTPAPLAVPHPDVQGVAPEHIGEIPDHHLDLLDQTGENATTWQAPFATLMKAGVTLPEAYQKTEANANFDAQIKQLTESAQSDNQNYSQLQTNFGALQNQQPAIPQYQPPHLGIAQALLGGLGAVLGGRFAAQNAEGALQGPQMLAQQQYQRAVQQFGEGNEVHQEQVKNALAQMQMANGRSETEARLVSELVGRQAQLDYQNQYRQGTLENRLQSIYDQAKSLPEMMSMGAKLGLSPEDIKADYSQRQQTAVKNAFGEWNKLLGDQVAYGGIQSQAQADRLNEEKIKIAGAYGIDPGSLPDAQTGDTEAAKRQQQIQQNWQKAFAQKQGDWTADEQRKNSQWADEMGVKHQQLDQAETRLGYMSRQVDIAQQSGNTAAYRAAIESYSAETNRYNALVKANNDEIDKKLNDKALGIKAQIAGYQNAIDHNPSIKAKVESKIDDLKGQAQFLQEQIKTPKWAPDPQALANFGMNTPGPANPSPETNPNAPITPTPGGQGWTSKWLGGQGTLPPVTGGGPAVASSHTTTAQAAPQTKGPAVFEFPTLKLQPGTMESPDGRRLVLQAMNAARANPTNYASIKTRLAAALVQLDAHLARQKGQITHPG